MGAFKYETILPPSKRDGGLVDLKSDLLEKERNTSYAKGFKDGVNVTKDAVEVETNRLLSRINEDLSDLRFTNEQACAAVMKSVQPLIEAVISQLSPDLLRDKLFERANEALTEIFRSYRGVTVEIEAAPSLQPALKALCEQHGFDVTLFENDVLNDLEVRLNWKDGFDHLDMDAMRQTIHEKLNNYIDCLEEGSDERRREPG